MPTHITEALRTNMSGGKTVAQMLSDASAIVPFMSLAELKASLENRRGALLVLDVRERDAYEAGHIPGVCTFHAGSGSYESTTSCRTQPCEYWFAVNSGGSRHSPRQHFGRWDFRAQ